MCTEHLQLDRKDRILFIKQKIGLGKTVDSFYWNRNHKNGPEIHFISSTGIITIINAKTYKVITCLIARPAQIRRYYEANNLTPPAAVIQIAQEHERLGYNYI